MVAILSLAACGTAATPTAQPVVQQPTAVQALPTATEPPLPTATEAPTATLEPTATQPPTATAVPALAVVKDGFDAWCAPQNYAANLQVSLDAPSYARKLTVKDGNLQVPIPATYCMLIFKFNQPAPQDASVTFVDAGNPFLKLKLQPAADHPDEAWTVVNHTYVVNPPLWFVTYKVSVTTQDGKELWSNPVKFSRPIPQTCLYSAGQLPDPVTLQCPVTDPWEVEPHPWTTYPWPHDRLLTPTAVP